MFAENIKYLEECYERYIYLCNKKGVRPNIEVKKTAKCIKKDYFSGMKRDNKFPDNKGKMVK
jgi:hypothetical protein